MAKALVEFPVRMDETLSRSNQSDDSDMYRRPCGGGEGFLKLPGSSWSIDGGTEKGDLGGWEAFIDIFCHYSATVHPLLLLPSPTGSSNRKYVSFLSSYK